MAILSGFYSILAHSASPESMKLPVYGRKDNLPLRRTRTELIVVTSGCLLNWTLVLAPSSLIGPSEVSRKRSQPAWRHLSGKTHLDKEWKNNTDQVSEISNLRSIACVFTFPLFFFPFPQCNSYDFCFLNPNYSSSFVFFAYKIFFNHIYRRKATKKINKYKNNAIVELTEVQHPQ